MKHLFTIVVLVALAFVSACAVGPDYHRPPVETPAAYKEDYGPWHKAAPQNATIDGDWWRAYHDPVLNVLEKQIDVSNQPLKAALAAYREAAAVAAESRTALFPKADVAAEVGKMHGTMPRPMLPESLAVGGSWEPDLWGRIRRETESAAARTQASASDLAAARLSLQAMLATDYFDLRAQDARAQLLGDIVETDRKSLQIARYQYATGTGSADDVLMAETRLENARAKAVKTGVRRAQLVHAIAVLVGKPPADFSLAVRPYRDAVPVIPVGLPSALLERRPDIAAAERRMAAANAKIGVVTAAWFPDITLSASAGYTGMTLDKALQAPMGFWAFGAGFAETLFDAGRRADRITAAQAAFDRSVAMYRQTVLTAFRQVEDGLSSLRVLGQSYDEQNAAALHAKRTEQLAQRQYASGIGNYRKVLIGRAIWLKNKVALLKLHQSRLDASIGLIRALGGGWSISQETSPITDCTTGIVMKK